MGCPTKRSHCSHWLYIPSIYRTRTMSSTTIATRPLARRWITVLLLCGSSRIIHAFAIIGSSVHTTTTTMTRHSRKNAFAGGRASNSVRTDVSSSSSSDDSSSTQALFDDFVEFLMQQQTDIIQTIEDSIERSSGARFTRDPWGLFAEQDNDDDSSSSRKRNKRGTPKKKKASPQPNSSASSGGITRVLQGGTAIEKGACSLTLIRQGVLTADRASTIRSRQVSQGDTRALNIAGGDTYAAAALSMVLHSRNPLVPTFRSDVRVFLVTDKDKQESWAWFGGGADLTPYYLFQEDVRDFHGVYKELCDDFDLNAEQEDPEDDFSYEAMKLACDKYFYLPARGEHRGTGGIFFDDLNVTPKSLDFTKAVTNAWMPSWIPIVETRGNTPYTDQQKQWQKLRRGRYLEFNLLYDRGVKFGLMTPNPRVEGVMVSAPPEIAYEYNHEINPGSPEASLVQVLKTPQNWV